MPDDAPVTSAQGPYFARNALPSMVLVAPATTADAQCSSGRIWGQFQSRTRQAGLREPDPLTTAMRPPLLRQPSPPKPFHIAIAIVRATKRRQDLGEIREPKRRLASAQQTYH